MSISKKNLKKLLVFLLTLNYISAQYLDMDAAMEKPFREYVSVSRQGQLLPGRKMEKSDHPKITLIIPMYNEEKNVVQVIRSIQNQSLQEIEIICINDNSNDKTLSILKSLQKLDPRIKIIKNQKNMGIMYSRMFGALESKGEYVTFLDCDDLYIEPKILKTAYETAEEKDLDIIQYEYVGGTFENGDTYNFLSAFVSKEEYYKIKRKPEVKKILFGQRESQGGSGIVYDKLYSRNLIKKMGLYLGEDLIYKHLIFMEDFLISFGAFRCADNFMLMKMFGVWHWHQNPDGMTSKVSQIENDEFVYPEYSNKKIGDYLFIWEKMFDMTENEPELKKLDDELSKCLFLDENDEASTSIESEDNSNKNIKNKKIKICDYLYLTEDRINKVKNDIFNKYYWIIQNQNK